MEFKIGIVGAAGTGKTSLAEALSAKLGISVEVTGDNRGHSERDGYDFVSGVQIERFLATSGRPNELLRRTIEQQAVPQFVTDRTVVDLAAYAVCELHDMDSMAVRRIIETCRKNVAVYTHLFLCPWKDVPVENNKRRTLNPWYQFLIHIVEMGMLREWGCSYTVLSSNTTEERTKEILNILGV